MGVGSCSRRDWQKEKKRKKKLQRRRKRGRRRTVSKWDKPSLRKGQTLGEGKGRGPPPRPPAPDARAGLPSPGVEAAARNGFPAKAAVFKPLGS